MEDELQKVRDSEKDALTRVTRKSWLSHFLCMVVEIFCKISIGHVKLQEHNFFCENIFWWYIIWSLLKCMRVLLTWYLWYVFWVIYCILVVWKLWKGPLCHTHGVSLMSQSNMLKFNSMWVYSGYSITLYFFDRRMWLIIC